MRIHAAQYRLLPVVLRARLQTFGRFEILPAGMTIILGSGLSPPRTRWFSRNSTYHRLSLALHSEGLTNAELIWTRVRRFCQNSFPSSARSDLHLSHLGHIQLAHPDTTACDRYHRSVGGAERQSRHGVSYASTGAWSLLFPAVYRDGCVGDQRRHVGAQPRFARGTSRQSLDPSHAFPIELTGALRSCFLMDFPLPDSPTARFPDQKCSRSLPKLSNSSSVPVPVDRSISSCSSTHVCACGMKIAFSPAASAGLMSERGLFPIIHVD